MAREHSNVIFTDLIYCPSRNAIHPAGKTLCWDCLSLPWHSYLVVSSLCIPCLFIVKGNFPSAQQDTGFNCFLLGCSCPEWSFVWLSQAGFASGENIYQEHLFILFTQGGPLCTFWGTFGLSSWDPWKISICVLLMPSRVLWKALGSSSPFNRGLCLGQLCDKANGRICIKGNLHRQTHCTVWLWEP